jgi:membrane-associated phospholipid phosphatase
MVAALTVSVVFVCAGALFSDRRWGAALVVAGLLTAFTGLAIGVHTHGWATAFDAPTASWIEAGRHRSHRLDVASLLIARIGNPAAIAAAGLVSGALLSWRARSAIPGVIVISTVAAAALAKITINAVVDRPMTHAELHVLPLMSTEHHPFPSGHVTGTAALLGIVAVYFGVGRSHTVRALLAGLVVAGALIVAFTRLYLGEHWLTDVVGGALLAAVFVILGAVALGIYPRSGHGDLASNRSRDCAEHRRDAEGGPATQTG